MPYKRSISGKHKITGDLAAWVEKFDVYYRTDFPQGPQFRRLSFNIYLTTMTTLLAKEYRQGLPAGAVRDDIEVYYRTFQSAIARDDTDSYIDMAMYTLLDLIVQHVPAGELSKTATGARRKMVDNADELLFYQ